MAAYRWVYDLTCGLTTYRPGSAPESVPYTLVLSMELKLYLYRYHLVQFIIIK